MIGIEESQATEWICPERIHLGLPDYGVGMPPDPLTEIVRSVLQDVYPTMLARAGRQGYRAGREPLFEHIHEVLHEALEALEELNEDLESAGPKRVEEIRIWITGRILRAQRFAVRLRHRKESRRKTITGDYAKKSGRSFAVDPAEEVVHRRERVSRIRAALLKLTNEERGILLWYYFDGLDVAEIGERLELSSDAVYKRLSRARESLREEYGGEL